MFGLSFLNTLFLWGLTAASIPIIIHLLKRNRAVKLPFAAMRFLQVQPKDNLRSQRLKQILLLLMRIMALALLAFAFARPFFDKASTKIIWANEPQSAVVLIDNSFSMAHGNAFEQAGEKAKEVLSSFRPGDQVAVVQFSESAQQLAQTNENFSALQSALANRLRLSDQGTNYITGIQAASNILRESSFENKSIYLISDFQKTGWVENYLRFKLDPNVVLHLVPVGNQTFSNAAVAEVKVAGKEGHGQKHDILVRVQNFGEKRIGANLELFLNEKRIDRRDFQIPAGQELVVPFKEIGIGADATRGEVRLSSDSDELPIDDTYYFVYEYKSSLEILAVNGEEDVRDVSADELFFVERAINLPRSAVYKLVATTPKKVGNYDFNRYRAVILANVKSLDRDLVARLQYYVRNGGGLIIALGDQIKPAIFNQLFADLSPAAISGLALPSIDRNGGAILAEIDYQHPIFRPFSEPGHGDPSTVQFYQHYVARPKSPEWVLARFDDGTPAILEQKMGSGKVILLTSTLDSEWNNMAVKPIFLPFLYQTLRYVATENSGEKSYLVGEPVPVFKGPARSAQNAQSTIITPGGEKVETSAAFFETTSEPGIYEVIQNGSKKGSYFAVNVDSRESDLSRFKEDEFEQKIEVSTQEAIQTAALGSADLHSEIEKRQKLWRFILMGVILLLIGETWLANRTYR